MHDKYYTNENFREGYLVGDLERIALANSNSDLRSDLHHLRQQLEQLEDITFQLASALGMQLLAHPEDCDCEADRAMDAWALFRPSD